jgi:hypothetical protein
MGGGSDEEEAPFQRNEATICHVSRRYRPSYWEMAVKLTHITGPATVNCSVLIVVTTQWYSMYVKRNSIKAPNRRALIVVKAALYVFKKGGTIICHSPQTNHELLHKQP